MAERRSHQRTRGRWRGRGTRGTTPKSSRPPPSAAASAVARGSRVEGLGFWEGDCRSVQNKNHGGREQGRTWSRIAPDLSHTTVADQAAVGVQQRAHECDFNLEPRCPSPDAPRVLPPAARTRIKKLPNSSTLWHERRPCDLLANGAAEPAAAGLDGGHPFPPQLCAFLHLCGSGATNPLNGRQCMLTLR